MKEGELPGFVRLLPSAGALPLGVFLTHSIRALARRNPRLFDRLGEHRTASFLVDPTDLSFAFLMVPDAERAEVRVVGKRDSVASDVTIRGPLLMLLGLLDGSLDGDALFFHRVISVQGRTDAVLALRNTLEDADLKPADLLGLQGQPAQLANRGILGAIGLARRLTEAADRRRRAETSDWG